MFNDDRKSWYEGRNAQLHNEFFQLYTKVYGVQPNWIYILGGKPRFTEKEIEAMIEKLKKVEKESKKNG
jgi:hypothetical protein